MKLRIVKNPRDDKEWSAEIKRWWGGWRQLSHFWGDDAEERAEAYAKNYLNPTVREFTKEK